MLWGRPTNLWLGLVTTAAGSVSVMLILAGVDPTIVAGLVGAVVSVLGAVIALVAYSPPTLLPGDTFNVQTPGDLPNFVTTVATPPHADLPPVVQPEG